MTDHIGLSQRDLEVLAELRGLAEMEEGGDYVPAAFELGPYTAWTLVSVLQLAWRHPELTSAQKQIVEGLARPLQAEFTGLLAEVLEEGWDVDKDVPQDEPKEGGQ